MTSPLIKTPFSRVFLTEDGAAPGHQPFYLAFGRAGATDFGLGTVTPVRVPSRDRYGAFDVVDRIKGQADLPTMPVEVRMEAAAISRFLRIANKGCPIDVGVHFGSCTNPEDFDGWEMIRILEDAEPTNYGSTDLGAIDDSQEAVITETLALSGLRMYDVKKLRPGEMAGSEVTDPIVAVVICDAKSCGDCGIDSDGCQIVFAVTNGSTGSPGLPAELLYTQNGGLTWAATAISTLALAEAPTGAACVGKNLVVISEDSGSLHYAPIADILAGTETWTEVTTGFVTGPRAIYSASGSATWIVGAGGYVYFSDDITAGVDVQADGTLTAQDLNAIHGTDRQNLITVGDSNAALITTNGGATWTLFTGPSVGIDLNAIAMRSPQQFLIGTNGGRLYYTVDGGVTFTEKAFSGSGAGSVRAIQFASKNVGYMAHDTATPVGRILRTVNGGFSWSVLPEDSGVSMPDNDQISAIAACTDDVNVVFGGGIAANATDGFLVKFA